MSTSARPTRPGERLGRWLVSGPPLLYLLVFFAAPALIMVLASFRTPGDFGGLAPLIQDGRLDLNLDSYARFFTESVYAQIFVKSVWYALLTTFFCLLLAYPLAALIARSAKKHRDLLLLLVILPSWQARPSAPGLTLTTVVVLSSLVTMAPAALFPRGLFWLRYIALALAVVLSLLHWLVSRPRIRAVSQDLRRSSQVTLAVTGVSAMLLFLLMGVIRTTARSDYTIYGQLKEGDSYGIFQAPNQGYYP